MRYPRLRKAITDHWLGTAIGTCSAVIVVVACLIWARPATPASMPAQGSAIGYSPQNRPAPAFSLPQLESHGNIRLSALRGRPIVLNFWSSSCEVCQRESPAIAHVARAARSRVAFVGIDIYDVRKAAIAFTEKYHLTYWMAFDSHGSVATEYDVPALPETVFLASSGKRILAIDLGALTTRHLTAILHALYGVTV